MVKNIRTEKSILKEALKYSGFYQRIRVKSIAL